MKNVISQLIIDFQRMEIPVPSKRELEFPELKGNVRKAIVLTGVRRSGKTWSLYQKMNNLLSKGIPKDRMLYINFEDDRLSGLELKNLQYILDAYFELYPENLNKELHLFFDEIQEVEGWEKFIRRLLDQEKAHIYLTGSSSKMLSKEIATSLRGRTITKEIFPFNFRENLIYKGVDISRKISSKDKSLFIHHVKEYLKVGGFPEIINLSPQLQREVLQNYMDVVVYRDIIERHSITNTNIVKELLRYSLRNSSSLMSITKLYNRLKSEGKTVGKNLLYQLLDYFEDAYCIFPVGIYSHSIAKQNANPRKIYCVDSGLITAYTVKPEFEQAARLENTVYMHLRRKTNDIWYYRTNTGKEIDFLVNDNENKINLIQVCLNINDENTYNREVKALFEAMNELEIKHAVIVTLDDTRTIKENGYEIKVVSLYEWLLNPWCAFPEVLF